MAQPGAQAPRKPPVYNDEEIAALAAYVASLGPGPAIPDASDYSLDGLSRRGARGGRSPAVARSSSPTAPPATTSRAPAARCRAAATPRRSAASSRKHIYEAMLTGPQADGHLLQRQPVAGGEARRHRLPRARCEEQPELRRLRPRRPRPGERGPVRLARRHRRPGRLRGLDRRPHRPARRRRRWKRERRPRTVPSAGTTTPAATAGAGPRRADRRTRACPSTTWRPTDVDPKAEKRAERQVAGLFGLSTLCAVLFVVSYFAFDIGDDGDDTIVGLGASNVALGADARPRAAAHRHRR